MENISLSVNSQAFVIADELTSILPGDNLYMYIHINTYNCPFFLKYNLILINYQQKFESNIFVCKSGIKNLQVTITGSSGDGSIHWSFSYFFTAPPQYKLIASSGVGFNTPQV
jgi:hypothetical protein